MSFQAPLFLLGLAVVPLALAALALARRRPARYVVRFPAAPTLAAVAPAQRRWRRHVPPALLSLALAGLVLALARPEATVAVPVERASVVLVTDTSGSMEATDVAPSRLSAAKAAAERFLDRVPDELQVGLVGYSDAAHTVLAPTQDRDAVRTPRWPAWPPTAGPPPATRSPARCARSASGAKDAPPAAIVLLSDGATTVGPRPGRRRPGGGRRGRPGVHRRARHRRGDGADARTGQILRVPPDPEALREIAQLSGGRAFAAEDADALDAVYEGLGSRIGTREERREVSAGFAAAGLLLLAGAVATALRWRGRLP